MPNRDALWVLPNGTTTVVTVNEQGDPVEPNPGTKPVEPEIPAVEPVKQTRKRRKR